MNCSVHPQSPFARKVRAAAIERALDDRIELEYAEVVPGRSNRAYGEAINPLRKIPALVTDDGRIIYDSTVICEFSRHVGRRRQPGGHPRIFVSCCSMSSGADSRSSIGTSALLHTCTRQTPRWQNYASSI
jgi:hypothetical protein